MAEEQMVTFHYNKTVKQAEELTEVSNRIKTIAREKLGDSICEMERNWNGHNSKKYIQKGNKLKSKIEDSANDVKKIADAMKKIAINNKK